ncbi:hypothetical protein FHX75_13670 [Micromonospora palomenae]|uniref:Uncharacterized protein n=1 Tax=Micromonospora palomenae TaxID=1461247 RepID=A0A561VPS0_9ACTN|nr:hypothetical protein FHX75_13670 [Micromonospora palomenae]
MTSTHPAVELAGLRKSFGPVTAVDSLDLRIAGCSVDDLGLFRRASGGGRRGGE